MNTFQARRLAGFALAVIGLFGLNSMFGQLNRNGYVARVQELLSSADPVLPGSETRLLTTYLGLPVVDDLLALATVLWANVTDGSAPSLSLYVFQFGEQLVPIFLVMIVEASRVGHSHHALYYSVLWGYAMQTFGYAATMPVYAIIHLFTSPTVTRSGKPPAKDMELRDPASLSLEALIPAFTMGYLLPTLLMSWPASSPAVHQWLGAAWQGFPLYVVVYQHVFKKLLKPAARNSDKALSDAYNWAFLVASATQLLTYALILGAKILPGLYPDWALDTFTFTSVFEPGPFHSNKPLTSMVTVMHDFFKWDQYVGSAAALVWGTSLDVMSRPGELNLKECGMIVWEVLRWSAIAGPGGALMRLLQRRDERVLSEMVRHKSKDP